MDQWDDHAMDEQSKAEQPVVNEAFRLLMRGVRVGEAAMTPEFTDSEISEFARIHDTADPRRHLIKDEMIRHAVTDAPRCPFCESSYRVRPGPGVSFAIELFHTEYCTDPEWYPGKERK